MVRRLAICLVILGAACSIAFLTICVPTMWTNRWIQRLKSDKPFTIAYGGIFSRRDEGPVKAREALVAIGRPAIPALTEALRDSDALTRVNAAWALWRITGRSSATVPVLLDALKDEIAYQQDHCVNFDAVAALEEIGQTDEEAVLPGLTEILQRGDEWAAAAAAHTFERIGPAAKKALPALVGGLKGKRRGVAILCGRAMRRMGADAVPSLIEMLKDEDTAARRMAAWALSGMGMEAKAAVHALREAVQEPDSDTRERAAYALGNLGPEARETIPALIKALEDVEAEVRTSAANALMKIDPTGAALKDAVPPLQKAVTKGGIYDLTAAAEALAKIAPFAAEEFAVPALIEALKHENVNDRCQACRTLMTLAGMVSVKAAVPALREALKDVKDVRELAAQALSVID